MKNPFLPFEQEIIRDIIAPKIVRLFTSGTGQIDPPSSKKNLLDRFREQYSCTVSAPTFDRWLEVANIKVGHHFGLLNIPPQQRSVHSIDPGFMKPVPNPTTSKEMIESFMETQQV